MSSGLSPELVMRLMEDGQTQAAIARDFGVTRQYVSLLAKRGGFVNKFRVVSENLPWLVDSGFTENTIYKNLRRHAIARANGLDSLGKADRSHVLAFHKKLAVFNSVVDYDPSYPAVPGFTNTPGFAYVPREEGDEDFVIKLRPGLKLTSEGRKLWRLPAEVP